MLCKLKEFVSSSLSSCFIGVYGAEENPIDEFFSNDSCKMEKYGECVVTDFCVYDEDTILVHVFPCKELIESKE